MGLTLVSRAPVRQPNQRICQLGQTETCHTCGPFRYPPMADLHCSPIGGIIKKDSSCQLIMDLSQPKGLSINKFISKEEFTVQYSHFDEATDLVWIVGNKCLMRKLVIKHAFRFLPVRPEDGSYWVISGKTVILLTPGFHLDYGPHQVYSIALLT